MPLGTAAHEPKAKFPVVRFDKGNGAIPHRMATTLSLVFTDEALAVPFGLL